MTKPATMPAFERVMPVAQDLCEPAAYELEQAQILASSGRYTEAAVRIGRSVESTLYAVADEYAVGFSSKVIDPIEKIRAGLLNQQARILRERTPASVRGLSSYAKSIADCLGQLLENATLCDGGPSREPATNYWILTQIVRQSTDDRLKRRLDELQPVLDEVQKRRNQGAHAAHDRSRREIAVDEFEAMGVSAITLIETLLGLLIGSAARRFWSGNVPGDQGSPTTTAEGLASAAAPQ